ncbi:MAG: DEAD/DEAH box helicase family protein [Firmicutes bacterium]|nr:DEAD/DEAH box helicase family protein [Bacillota bacterium]
MKDLLQDVDAIFSAGGPLARHIDGYEVRPEQIQMARTILSAFKHHKHAVIESATGTGKSMAYLAAAVLWARTTDQKVVISTNTINLQEQLVTKDIPTLKSALEVEGYAPEKADFSFALVKGRSNYICRRRLKKLLEDADALLDSRERQAFADILGWVGKVKEGCRSEFPFEPLPELWEKICSEPDTCLRVKCPEVQDCFFMKARNMACAADLLVVNHHLLFADVSVRRELGFDAEKAVLPRYANVIFDEAHNVPDVAGDYLGCSVTRLQITRLLSYLYRRERPSASRPDGSIGMLMAVRSLLYKTDSGLDLDGRARDSLRDRIDGALVPGVIRAREAADTLFEGLAGFLRDLGRNQGSRYRGDGDGDRGHVEGQDDRDQGQDSRGVSSREFAVRLKAEVRKLDFWRDVIAIEAERTMNAFSDLSHALSDLAGALELAANGPSPGGLPGGIQEIKVEMDALSSRLANLEGTLRFIIDGRDEAFVFWAETGPRRNVRLGATPLDVAPLIRENLLECIDSVIFTSATLAIGENLAFFEGQVGLDYNQDRPFELIIGSPFRLEDQVLVGLPTDLPNPDDQGFVAGASAALIKVLTATKGRAFVLFTSYNMMERVDELIRRDLSAAGLTLLRQGEAPRHMLLAQFRATRGAVLLGADSFWEGVDVPGDALSCVVLVRLPFQVPSDPVVEARLEAMASRGENAFGRYSLPQAVIKFRQGFGRLIRTKTDRGVVIVLDRRIIYKGYGRAFLASLPGCRHVRGETDLVVAAIREWIP